MFVSILMPVYNAEAFLDAAISSVLQQTHDNFELLVGDDGSTDQTHSVLERYSDERIRVFRNDRNRGYVWTCNFLYSKAQGDIIGFQDADDISHPERLEKQLGLIKNDEDSFSGCNMRYMDYSGKLLSVVADKSNNIKQTYPRIGDSTLLMFRHQLEKAGGLYRPYFSNNQDYDLGLRLLDFFKYKNLDRDYYYYRNVPHSNSKDFSNPERVINGDLVRALAKQRRETGRDFLMDNNMDGIERMRREFLAPYQVDKTMMERRAVSYLLSIKMYRYAIAISMQAITKEPLRLSVYRTFFYMVRTVVVDKLASVSRKTTESFRRRKRKITHVAR